MKKIINNYVSKIKNLDTLKTSILKTLALFILSSVFLISLILGIFIFIYFSEAKSTGQQLIVGSNNLLQSKLASELEIIANNSNFVEYMRFGSISRNEYYTTMRWLFRNLDDDLIKSVLITDEQGTNIFEYGKPTNLYVTLELCYLNNKINFKLGNCEHNITLFFDQKYYIKQLKNINSNIVKCKNSYCNGIKPFQNKFAMFNIINSSKTNIPIIYQIEDPITLFSLFGIFSILLGTMLIFSHKILRNIISIKLVVPLNDITKQLKDGKPIDNDNNYLSELLYLTNIINDYKTHEVEIELGKNSKQIAHDIGSPLSSIEYVVGNFKDNIFLPEHVELLDESAKSLKGISSKLLNRYRSNKDQNYNIDDESIPRFFILFKVIKKLIRIKEIEWHNKKHTINYTFDKESSIKWCYASLAEMKAKLSNILNNAHESLGENGIINIDLSVINNNFLLIIQDNGIGIPENKIEAVLKGESSKHPGKGIGIPSANEYFKRINGQLQLESKLGKGTKITINIPIASLPELNPSSIKYNAKSIFVILDDDPSMHMLWQQKLGAKKIKLKLFINVTDFIEWHKSQISTEQFIYVVDYNLGDEFYNGFKVISELHIQKQSYLVTSHAEEAWLQDLCISNKILLVPKNQIVNYLLEKVNS